MAKDIPDLPTIPKMFKPRFYNKEKTNHGREVKGYNLKIMLDKYLAGETVIVPNRNSFFVKQHGCKMCPYWGSSHCYFFPDVRPPRTHANKLCPDRLEEIMFYLSESDTYSGKAARRAEVIHRIANHITMLEANLSDYRQKKYQALLDNGKGVTEKEFDDLSKEEIMLDTYEQTIMGQIQKLSDVYAGHMTEDMKLDLVKEGKSNAKKITFQQFNVQINEAAKELAFLENKEKKQLENNGDTE